MIKTKKNFKKIQGKDVSQVTIKKNPKRFYEKAKNSCRDIDKVSINIFQKKKKLQKENMDGIKIWMAYAIFLKIVLSSCYVNYSYDNIILLSLILSTSKGSLKSFEKSKIYVCQLCLK